MPQATLPLLAALTVWGCNAITQTFGGGDKPGSSRKPCSASAAAAAQFHISGGDVVSQRDYPYVGVILTRTANYEGICTGSLVCPGVVLTAAHCFDAVKVPPSSYKFSLSPRIDFTRQVTDRIPADAVAGAQLIVHPDYGKVSNTQTRAPDLAFLKLQRPIGSQFGKIASQEPINDGQSEVLATVVGYGYNQPGEKGAGIKRVGRVAYNGPRSATDRGTILTAMLEDKQQDTCEGDSGGPLLVNDQIYAVTSGGDADECGTPNSLSYYASVTNAAAWIQTTLTALCPASANAVKQANGETPNSGESEDCGR